MLNRFVGVAGVIDEAEVRKEHSEAISDHESIEVAFKTVRDVIVLTDHRIVFVDVKGMTGKRKEYVSIPYSKITKFAFETAGHFDRDCELYIWVGGERIERHLSKKMDIGFMLRTLGLKVH